VDYYFFYGPELNQVIAEYRQMTGAAPLLPQWHMALAVQGAVLKPATDLDTAAEFRTRKIPVDVIVQDWQYWASMGGMRCASTNVLSEPAQLMTQLHEEDIHLVASVWRSLEPRPQSIRI